MSGFSNEAKGGSGKFANFKDGMIITKIDGEKKTFSHLTGHITRVYVDDAEYDKKPYRKLIVAIEHADGETLLGFPLSSGYGKAFCCILPNVDPMKEVKISGGITKDEKDPLKKYASLFIEQDGKFVPWYYSKKNNNTDKIPEVKDVTIGRGRSAKTAKDYTDRDDFFERLIAKFDDNLDKKLKGRKDKVEHIDAAEITESIDDLPF